MNLLIMGAPGAGKGTMSKRIIPDFGIVHISTGDMLREAIANKTPVGLKAQEYMNDGHLVPDEIIHDIIVERLKQDDIKNGFLFDGYPRTVNQAIDLTNILEELNIKLDKVINLDISDEVLMRRITGRRVCPNCGEIFNVYYKPTKVEGICDKCQSALTIRKDDTAESLEIRLSEYHKNTQPVLEYYQKTTNCVANIPADREREEVYADVKVVLEGLK